MPFNLRPINNKCVDCGEEVHLAVRQELAWDDQDNPRRRCETCMNKRKGNQQK